VAKVAGITMTKLSKLRKREAKFTHKVIPMSRNPAIIAAVRDQIDRLGLQQLSIAKVRVGLQARLARVPSKSLLTRMVKREFGLSFKHFNTAKIRYNHAAFDEKRLWISRLLTFLLSQDAVVVSIDESSFSTKIASNFRWQPKCTSGKLLQEFLCMEKQRLLERQAHDAAVAAFEEHSPRLS
jgi:hypothetical protein